MEKVECKDSKKIISKINLEKHLLTKTHINNFIKVKIEKIYIKKMYICPCGVKFNDAHRKSQYGTKIHKLYTYI